MRNRDLSPADIAAEGLADVLSGFALLTRLPVPVSDHAPNPEAAWAWPIVGVVVSGLSALVGGLAVWLGVAPGPAAALVLITGAMVTGGLHEDGLADCADGFFGGRDKARRLEIMKDSAIGSFGAVALGLVGILRWSALAAIIAGGHWGVILAAGALSRAPMAALMSGMVNARGAGLSASVGRPSVQAAAGACGLALGIAVLAAGWLALAMAFWVGAVTAALGWLAQRKIGGQTGDVLGASQQVGEAAALAIAG